MESSETGDGDPVLKARTSRTARCDASDEVRLMNGLRIVGDRSRVEGNGVFVFQNLRDTKRSGEVFEESK